MQRSPAIRILVAVCAVCALSISFAVGAPPAPNTGPSNDPFTQSQRDYWAFQKVIRPELPEAKQHPIDSLVAAKLVEKGLEMAPRADKITLIRRAYFDLIGMPPTPEEVEAFLNDDSPKAFETVIDRLLDSPHYGERWARHWLDLARYAESEGFKSDETRPNAWRYRDYVINAFNEDKPYDRFVREQIAGDELWPDDHWARVATAFNRNYPDETNAANLWLRRQEILQDITDVVGQTFLGMTYGCAKCHDHKFDPILQADYYRLQAFFANSKANDNIVMWPEDKVAEHGKKLAAWEESTQGIRDEMESMVAPKRKAIIDERFYRYHPDIQEQLKRPKEEQTPFERQMYAKFRWQMEFVTREKSLVAKLSDEEKERYEALRQELKSFEHMHPGEIPVGVGMRDLGKQAPPTHILTVANYAAPAEEVQPGFLSILDPAPAKYAPPEGLESTGRRTALANWLASPENPLTGRVMANRIWQHHFGRGIVATPSDFGLMGERPTHPELLDWLTDEFVRTGWSMKKMHRLIMTSETYQQSSDFREASNEKDPFNRLLWRYPPRRLEGEVIRDSALKVARLLNPAIGGKSVFPPLPRHMPEPRGGWEMSEDAADQNRRSVYVFVRRNARYPMLQVYDMPDTHATCARREVTMTAPQALAYLNSDQTMSWAQSFAGRVVDEAGSDQNAQIEQAYRIAYSRSPDGWEKDSSLTFLDRHAKIIADREAEEAPDGEPAKLALPTVMAENLKPAQAAALVDFCHSILNSNEFVFRY